jgi:N-succinyldiaminopimelate aminotransferase
VLLNTPHNPTGTVLDEAELAAVAELAVERDLVVVTDEVYEHMAYETAHRPLATFPGMAERTLTISSGGKTFSFTGWKVGWATGPAQLVRAVLTAKQFLTFVSGAPFQPAIAAGLRLPDEYFTGLREGLRAKRDRLVEGLRAGGLAPYVPQGTYFVTADVRPLGYRDGVEFCRDLPHKVGVVAIPHQVFYDDVEAGRPLVRFAFCKRDEVLDEAVSRLSRLS